MSFYACGGEEGVVYGLNEGGEVAYGTGFGDCEAGFVGIRG